MFSSPCCQTLHAIGLYFSMESDLRWIDWIPNVQMYAPRLGRKTTTKTTGYAPAPATVLDRIHPIRIVGSGRLLPSLMAFGGERLRTLTELPNRRFVPAATLAQYQNLLVPGARGTLSREATCNVLFIDIYTLIRLNILPALENRHLPSIEGQLPSSVRRVDITMDFCLVDEDERIVVAVECKSYSAFDAHASTIERLAFANSGMGTQLNIPKRRPNYQGGKSILIKVSFRYIEEWRHDLWRDWSTASSLYGELRPTYSMGFHFRRPPIFRRTTSVQV
jgi:hypothetical protein